jgi:hypothetical protein
MAAAAACKARLPGTDLELGQLTDHEGHLVGLMKPAASPAAASNNRRGGTTTMVTTPAEGTRIAFSRAGDGPSLTLSDGALCHRAVGPKPAPGRTAQPRPHRTVTGQWHG